MELMTDTKFNEVDMGTLAYRVKVPELAEAIGLGAMDLVRFCGIAVGTAYKVLNSSESSDVSLDSCWKIFKGLRENRFTIDGREIQWSDIVEVSE
jgi:hypothetical protein